MARLGGGHGWIGPPWIHHCHDDSTITAVMYNAIAIDIIIIITNTSTINLLATTDNDPDEQGQQYSAARGFSRRAAEFAV